MLGALGKIGVVGNGIPLPRRVRNILSKYNASLILPGEQTPVLGPELILDPLLSDASYWANNTNGAAVINNGVATFTNCVSGLGIYKPGIIEAGKSYVFEAVIDAVTSGSFEFRSGSSLYSAGATSSPGVYRRVVTPTVTAVGNAAFVANVSGSSGVITSFSVREILSYSDTHNGFNTGNYTDSVGSIPATIDGNTGLVIDAAGSVGPELVTTPSVTGVAIDGATGVRNYVVGSVNLLTSKTFEVSAVISGYSGSGDVGFSSGTAAAITGVTRISGNGTIKGVITGAGSVPQMFTSPITNTCTFSNISVRELPGIHATQPTTQNKPALRRGLVNLLLNNQGGYATYVGSGCSTASVSISGYANSVQFPAGNTVATAYKLNTLVNGQTYTIAAIIQMDDGSQPVFSAAVNSGDMSFQVNNAPAAATSVTHLGNNVYLAVRTFTSTAYETSGIVRYAEQSGKGFRATSYALFTGTVTAQQILAAGGIPVTTTAPASSAIGPQYWQFDGTDDRLQLSAVPFHAGDDFAIICGLTPVVVDANRRIFNATGAGSELVELYSVATAGNSIFRVRDAAGVDTFTGLSTPNLLNRDSVVTARKLGNAKSVRIDGVLNGTSSTATGAGTLTAAAICSTTAGFNTFSGRFAGAIFIKGNPTDSELLTLERFLATLQGRRI